VLLLATSQGKSTTSGGIILDSLDENKIRGRELLKLSTINIHRTVYGKTLPLEG
jgi:hypothetical protein